MTGSENLELVRSIFAAWERGDYGSADWAHPEIEFTLPDGPTPGRWTGVAEMAQAWGQWVTGAWAHFRVEAEEFRELDDERVLALVLYSGRGKTSGLELGQLRTRGAGLFHIRDGKVTRFVGYWDRERALADLGLVREDDLPAP